MFVYITNKPTKGHAMTTWIVRHWMKRKEVLKEYEFPSYEMAKSFAEGLLKVGFNNIVIEEKGE